MIMSGIESDKKQKRLEVSADVVKVVVMGAPRVGKTSFIRGFWEHHEPSPMYSYNGATVYPCKILDEGIVKTALIFEIPSDPGFFEYHVLHSTDVNILVWMYAIDDPTSVNTLRNNWLPQVAPMLHLNRIFSVLVGNKQDLRDDPRVFARLAEEGLNLVTSYEVEDLSSGQSFEISAHTLEDVDEVFDIMFHLFFHLHEDAVEAGI